MDKMREAFEAYALTNKLSLWRIHGGYGYSETAAAWRAWKAATARCVPEGWVAVPEEPTEAMIDMGRGWCAFPEKTYDAMLAAAPKPGEQT